jgi:membrane-associated phospholipid phosphatase
MTPTNKMTRRRSLFRSSLFLVIAAFPAYPANAQVQVAPDTAKNHPTLFTGKDAVIAAGFAAVTVAMFPADKYLARHLRNQSATPDRFVDRSAKAFEFITSPGAYIIGPALYVYGRASNHPGIEDLGWHGTEAAILGSVITGALKVALGRSRPYVSNDTNPHDFKFAKGTSSDRQSFPSGHTTTAFAVASSVTAEVQRMWPQYTWYAAPVMYGGATLVGLSRMYHDQHWASDIALGAAVGTFSGLKVVRYTHDHPDNFIDRAILKANIASDGRGGALVAWSVPMEWSH